EREGDALDAQEQLLAGLEDDVEQEREREVRAEEEEEPGGARAGREHERDNAEEEAGHAAQHADRERDDVDLVQRPARHCSASWRSERGPGYAGGRATARGARHSSGRPRPGPPRWRPSGASP